MNNPTDRTALTEAEAIKLHDKFASDFYLAFNYFFDGCAHRTHMMGQHSDLKGISLKKAWAYGKAPHYLEFTSPSGRKQQWLYHIALCAPVKKPQTSLAHDHIFDPAMFDGPVLFEQWKSALANKGSKFFIRKWNKHPKIARGNFSLTASTDENTTQESKDTLRRFTKQLDVETRVLLSSPLKNQFAKAASCPTAFNQLHRGNGWISETIYRKPALR